MKNALIITLNFFLASCLAAQENKSFNPEGFNKQTTVHVNTNLDEAFYLYGPHGRKLWMSEKLKKSLTQTELLPQKSESVEGKMFMQKIKAHNREVLQWVAIADHDSTTYTQRIVLFIPKVEFLIGESSFKENPKGGTDVTTKWRVVGISPDGNVAVINYEKSGAFERQQKEKAKQLNQYLKGRS